MSNLHCDSNHLDLFIVMRGKGALTNARKQAPVVHVRMLLKVPQMHVGVNKHAIRICRHASNRSHRVVLKCGRF